MPFEPAVDPQETSVAWNGHGGQASYEVRITNLTRGQPMTPPLAVTHGRSLSLFRVGRRASEGIQQIAENGNLAPMLAALDGARHVSAVVVAAGDPVPPLLPGEERVFPIDGDRGAKYLSFVSMLICTNDGFAGLNRLRLPRRVGETVSAYARSYDAGTERNTEDFDDLVPPCGPLTGVDSGGAGTGESNPALAEGRVVRGHRGIKGRADLTRDIHGWRDPVAHIVVTRVN